MGDLNLGPRDNVIGHNLDFNHTIHLENFEWRVGGGGIIKDIYEDEEKSLQSKKKRVAIIRGRE